MWIRISGGSSVRVAGRSCSCRVDGIPGMSNECMVERLFES